MRYLLCLAILLSPPFAFSQSVTLPAEVKAKAGRPVFINPVVDGDDVHWEIDAGLDDWVTLLPPEIAKNFGNTKIFYADKGTYTVRAWTAKVIGSKAKLSPVATCIIVIDGGNKPPPVDPPKPSAAKHITFIGPDAKSATVITELKAYLKAAGIVSHAYAADDPLIKSTGFQKGVDDAGGVPCFVVQDAKGNILGQASVTTAAAAREFLKTWER